VCVKVLGERRDSHMEEENRHQLCPCRDTGGGGTVGVESGNASDAEKTESMLDSIKE
jgi:hypothetical protein